MNRYLFLVLGLFMVQFELNKCQCPFSFELNVDFKGNDLLEFPLFVNTVQLCCNACNQYSNCMAYTYVPGNNACWLKNSTDLQRSISTGRKLKIFFL